MNRAHSENTRDKNTMIQKKTKKLIKVHAESIGLGLTILWVP
jgi:hypothetical protein